MPFLAQIAGEVQQIDGAKLGHRWDVMHNDAPRLRATGFGATHNRAPCPTCDSTSTHNPLKHRPLRKLAQI